jgi:hypothetical protein
VLIELGQYRRSDRDRRGELEVGRGKLEVGGWRLEDGSWKMEDGSWELEVRRGKLGDGRKRTLYRQRLVGDGYFVPLAQIQEFA